MRMASPWYLAVTALLTAAPAVAQTPQWTPERMIELKRISAVVPAPDGARVAWVVGTPSMEGEKSEYVSQVWLANRDGGNAVQLTRAEKSSTSPEWSPDGRWLAFLSARGGESQVYRLPVSGGEAEQLTKEKGGVSAFGWSPDGQSIAYVSTEPRAEEEEKASKEKRDARVVDETFRRARLFVLPLEGARTAKQLSPAGVHVGQFDWSPDGRSIAFEHSPTPKVFEQVDVSVVDVAGGGVRVLRATRAFENDPQYSPDGKWIALTVSDDPPTWAFTTHVHVVPAAGGEGRALAKTFDEQPDVIGWTPDSKRIVFTEAQGVTQGLFSLPVEGGAPTRLSPAELQVGFAQLNARGSTIGFTGQDVDRPLEAFVTPLERWAPVQVSRVQGALPGAIARTEVVRWKSGDGRDVEGLLTLPQDHRPGTRFPLLVVVHGGPTGVFLRTFIGAPSPYPIAAFAERGYGVLRVNPRGSSGYGREFRYANYKDWGGGDYRDIMTGVDHLVERGMADPERLGIMGWSYGGYMTSWVITQTQRFKAASVGAGVTNLMSFTGTSDIPGFVPDYMGGEYWDTFDTWRTHSAMFNVKGVKTPTLIQHGEQDVRVPISQGYELYNALKRQGVDVQMVVYPRQPHGIQEPKLIVDAMRRNLEWFGKWIPVGPTAAR